VQRLALALAILAGLAKPAAATNWYVDANSSTGGDGSAGNPFDRIADAVAVAVDGDRVFVAPATYDEQLRPVASIEVRGTGVRPGDTVITTFFAAIVYVPAGTLLLLQNVQISGVIPAQIGILNSGTLYVNDCVIRDCVNYATGFGHGSVKAEGGGIYNDGTASLVGCTIADNATSTYAVGGETSRGGGICNRGTMRMEGCTVSGNRCDVTFDYGVGEGAGVWNGGELELENCTISGNVIEAGHASGGGLYHAGTSTTLRSCTIAGNTSDGTGRNDAHGGGLFGTFVADHLVVAGNAIVGIGVGPDFEGTLDSLGYNLVGDDSGLTIIGDPTGNLVDVDPLLQPLADNGGPVLTQALGAGSAALDSGNPDPTAVLANDARRYGRAAIARGVGVADRGAVEMGAIEALDLRATPDRGLAVGDFVTMEVTQGSPNQVFALFREAIDGTPVFTLELLDFLDPAGAWTHRFQVPNDPSILGKSVTLRAYSLNGTLRLIRSAGEEVELF
jgi:hypothetical protein